MAQDPHAFGKYLRAQRKECRLTLRALATALKLSVPYLSDIERGERPPLPRKYWGKLVSTLNTIDRDELEAQAALARPVEFDVTTLRPRCRELLLKLSRRIHDKSLTETECCWLLDTLEMR